MSPPFQSFTCSSKTMKGPSQVSSSFRAYLTLSKPMAVSYEQPVENSSFHFLKNPNNLPLIIVLLGFLILYYYCTILPTPMDPNQSFKLQSIELGLKANPLRPKRTTNRDFLNVQKRA